MSQLPKKSAISARSSIKRSNLPKLETLAETEARNETLTVQLEAIQTPTSMTDVAADTDDAPVAGAKK